MYDTSRMYKLVIYKRKRGKKKSTFSEKMPRCDLTLPPHDPFPQATEDLSVKNK